jgi:hypothetical protein
VTVNLPDEIAAYLDAVDNASATVAEALRAQMDRGRATEAILRAVGYDVTEAGKQRAHRELPPLTTEQQAEIERRRDLLRSGNWPTDSAA